MIIVFDLTKSDSFYHITDWLNNVKDSVDRNACIVLVGNKSDLKEERVISYTDAARFCQENEMFYFETSAFVGEGVSEVFTSLAKSILTKVDNGQIELDDKAKKIFPIKEVVENESMSSGGRCSSC